jgi:hypothetical protein
MVVRFLGLAAVTAAASLGLALAATTAAGAALDFRRLRTERFDHDWETLPSLRRESLERAA